MKIKNLLVLGFLVVNLMTYAHSATSPSEVMVTIKEVWVSPNADCTGMTRIYNNPSATAQDMVDGPTFGSVTVPNGTYQCVAWKMSDYLSFRPVANDAPGCTAGTNYDVDLFRDEDPDLTSTCPDGSVITATGSTSTRSEDNMCIYLSVNGNNTNYGMRPTEPFLLTSPYVVDGDQNGTMVTDFTGKVANNFGDCECQPPVFGFR